MNYVSLFLITTLFVAAVAIDKEPKQKKTIIGNPHLITWKNEHIEQEYLGQCDIVMVQDADFADEGLGLDIHIRTKIVRDWSYIRSVAIKIGNDVLEIQGSPNPNDQESHYWFNNKYQGEVEAIAGFPVMISKPTEYQRQYIIDLDSKYPGKGITIALFREFVRFNLNGDESVFGNTVGLLGDYKTGKKLSRDGASELNDIGDLGDEWQVLPGEPRLFHEVAHPQFPENCIRSENTRGDHRPESEVSFEQAESACSSSLADDPQAIQTCISYVLAAQDLGMVGDVLVMKLYHPELLL
eukprot:CAMPEP_0113615432 /NCGR_PEP_ID=MMETSP0017_2-20120614/7696_1 /TAXON_ID=2856 /ORGANISM="Cylindrotheca closterium" /LENGTH=296 /DNA_ID=CAMNT_0000524665 /DNA_START=10 /DNA_END=900 /DNA_ORIENTATION=- /assembly_acc=CAM_ASM_000147